MRRRVFLSTITASIAAACSNDNARPFFADEGETTVDRTAADAAATDQPEPTAPPDAATSRPSADLPSVEPITAPPVDLDDGAFGLGVASGEPDDRSVMLWTRLDGALPESVPVVWEIAVDDEFDHLLATGLLEVNGATGHALHALATSLQPATEYWYRFRAGDQQSPIGRTRTLPAAGSTEPVRLAISSCQDVNRGAYAAHADLAAADVDLVIWLGDYIYRGGTTLASFRDTYAAYRRNPQLQASHAAHAWFLITDDHEVANEYDATVDPGIRAAAYRAWWENQPTRLPEPTPAEPDLTFYRSVDIGSMARLILTDSRQYADGSTLYGEPQFTFLEKAVDHGARWTLVASSILASGIRSAEEVLLPYTLDGYPADRIRLAELLASAPQPLILSGDLHTGMILDFSADPTDPTMPVVATELMAPAISSTFPEQYAPYAPFLPLLNPHVKHIDVTNGWLLLELGTAEATAEYRTVADVADPLSAVEATFRFVV